MLAAHEQGMREWINRMLAASARNERGTQEEQESIKSRALTPLRSNDVEQRKLIKAAQDCKALIDELAGREDREARALRQKALQVRNDAQTLFTLCHAGFIEREAAKYINQMESEGKNRSGAIEPLRQAAKIGLMIGMDRFDLSYANRPLTYCSTWVGAEIQTEAEHGRLIRLKSKSHDLGNKIEQAVKQIRDNENRQPTVTELADRFETSPEKVMSVLTIAERRHMRLDAPISGDGEGETTFGALIVDPGQQVEGPVTNREMASKLREALSDLGEKSPFQRRVVELYFQMADNEELEQRELFDGIYRDLDTGVAYSAEDGVIRNRGRVGVDVEFRSQKELNQAFESGELVFEPGTPESHELARIVMGDYDPAAPYERYVSAATGIPPTSGTVQEALKKGLTDLSTNDKLQGFAPRYRGENEIENSGSAADKVRHALRDMGKVTEADLRKLQSMRSVSGGKSRLRIEAEKAGLVDPQTGRLNNRHPAFSEKSAPSASPVAV